MSQPGFDPAWLNMLMATSQAGQPPQTLPGDKLEAQHQYAQQPTQQYPQPSQELYPSFPDVAQVKPSHLTSPNAQPSAPFQQPFQAPAAPGAAPSTLPANFDFDFNFGLGNVPQPAGPVGAAVPPLSSQLGEAKTDYRTLMSFLFEDDAQDMIDLLAADNSSFASGSQKSTPNGTGNWVSPTLSSAESSAMYSMPYMPEVPMHQPHVNSIFGSIVPNPQYAFQEPVPGIIPAAASYPAHPRAQEATPTLSPSASTNASSSTTASAVELVSPAESAGASAGAGVGAAAGIKRPGSPRDKARALDAEATPEAAPSALSSGGALQTVPDEVYEQRLAERKGIKGRIAGKQIVEVELVCSEPGCSARRASASALPSVAASTSASAPAAARQSPPLPFAKALFHHSDSSEQVAADFAVKAQCHACREQHAAGADDKQSQNPWVFTAGSAAATSGGSPSDAAGGSAARRKKIFDKCDVCERKIGLISVEALKCAGTEGSTASTSASPSGAGAALSEKQRLPVEVICPECDRDYAWCTQCGGGGTYRTGKWRPRQLFPEGKKTCRLRTLRLSGTPSLEIYDVGVPSEPVPQHVLDGVKEVFAIKALFRYAKPQYLRGGFTYDKLMQAVDDFWGFVERRLRPPPGGIPAGIRRVIGVMRGQYSVAVKGKSEESGILSFQILEWNIQERSIGLVLGGIALTGLNSAQWMLLNGRSICFRIFLMAHEPPDEHPDDPDHIERSVDKPVHPHPQRLFRLEPSENGWRIKYFLTKGWKEVQRMRVETIPPSSIKEWVVAEQNHVRKIEAFGIDANISPHPAVVELSFPFDTKFPVSPDTSTMVRVSKGKTILRPRKPHEKLEVPSFPVVRFGPEEAT